MNRLGDRLPVERLPERSRTRIERAVFAALDADAAQGDEVRAPAARPAVAGRSRAGWWMGAGAGVAVAAVALLMITRAPAPRRPEAVTALRVGGATTERVLLAGATIDLDAGGAAVVTGGDDDGYLVVLERGRARFDVRPRAGRPPFVVQAGQVRVEVIGTSFEVDRLGDRASVVVIEGRVHVLAPEGATTVQAGERWPAEGAAAAPAGGATGSAEEAQAHAEALEDSGIEIGPVAHAPIVEEPVAPRTDGARPKPARPGRRSEAAGSRPDDRDGPRSNRRDLADGELPDARARYERAAALETRDPDRALRDYRALAAGEGPWAAHALFAAARLELDRGHLAVGRALLEAYARRFPDGPNRDDVRLLLRSNPPR